jgi:hypothetical protein
VCALVGVGCLFALVIGPRVAKADGTLPFLGSFGSQGASAGQFELPRGVAIDDSSGPSKGDVYVADQGNQRVEKFNVVGGLILTFGNEVNATKVQEKAEGGAITEAEENLCTAASGDICVAGVNGAAGGQFFNPLGVAVDPTSGDVYVVDFSNHRIEKFSPDGEFLLAFGKEVNATTSANICTAASGDACQAGKVGTGEDEFEWALGSFIAVGVTGTVYVGDENRIQEYEPTGQSKGQIALSGAGRTRALAVDSSGDIYVASQAVSGVRKFEPEGVSYKQSATTFDTASTTITAVTFDPFNQDVVLVDTASPEGGIRVLQYTQSGALSAESSNELLQNSIGIAANASGTVYAADYEFGGPDMVMFFGEPPREGNPPPSIDTESVTGLGEESATIEAQINPYFLETSYRVEYVPAAGYDPSAPDPYTGPGGGTAPSAPEVLGGGAVLGDQPARVTVAALSGGTVYHYRFVAKSSAGTTYYSPDRTFATFQAGGLASLPDGRVYEQVSPQKKNGNEAGALVEAGTTHVATAYATTTVGGDRVAYYQNGPFGETSSGADEYSVSSRNPSSGWETSAALPPEYLANGDVLGKLPHSVLASDELSRFLFVALGPFAKENSLTPGDENLGLYRTRSNSIEPEWLSRPTFASFSEAKPEPGHTENTAITPAGGSPNLGTVYFTYFGTLVPTDNSRAPFVEPQGVNGPWGFYEWKEGVLSSASVLPNEPGEPGYEPGQPAGSGRPDPYGAVPAVSQKSEMRYPFAGPLLNQVSEDGSKAFFVSPEPAHATEAGTPTELYVREQHENEPATTALVSRDELNGGTPAPGSGAETAVTPVNTPWAPQAYAYASPDGSRAFFQSMDKLTDAEHGGEPTGSGPWTYEFDVTAEKLHYLPGVLGSIAASSRDGSSFIFENPAAGAIELWSGGEAPVEIASFSTTNPTKPTFEGATTSNGKVFVFDTNAVIKRGSQAFDNSSGLEQSYRYDVASQRLSCVSCAPDGAPQTAVETGVRFARGRAIADEGRRVFFATAAKLVSRDVNGVADVYEWEQVGSGSCRSEEREDGCVYLISSGTDPAPSLYLDNDEMGENVFFATKQGLARGDTDESYDVYDARENGGFLEAAAPPECASNCRPPGFSPSLSVPLTTAFGPTGNLVAPAESPPPPTSPPKPLTRAQKLAKALRACARKPKSKRAGCRKRARRQYGTQAKAKSSAGSGGRRG